MTMITASKRTQRSAGGPGTSVAFLNRALATELVCMFRYRRHYQAAKGIYSRRALVRLREQAAEECDHAERINERIIELGGIPDLRMETVPFRSFVRFHYEPADYRELFLPTLLEDDLLAERIAADAYQEISEMLAESDSRTSRLLRSLIDAEEAHAEGLDLLLQTNCVGLYAGADEITAQESWRCRSTRWIPM